MRKEIAILTLILIFVLILNSSGVQVHAAEDRIISRVVTTEEGKSYLEVDGKPFLMGHVQNCGTSQLYGNGEWDTNGYETPLPVEWLENCFEKTAASGYKTISIILRWRDFEPGEIPGDFDWSLIDKYVDWANAYNLKIDFAWFGSLGCGGTRLPGKAAGYSCHVPDYLTDMKYWSRSYNNGIYCPDLTGEDAEYIKEREYIAVNSLFNHLAEYDTEHTVILFQVQNEPNFHPDWGSAEMNEWLDYLGSAVKHSDYVVATRVNFTGHDLSATIDSLPNIDFVGSDPYTYKISDIRKICSDKANSTIPYIAENGGDCPNTSTLMAVAVAAGGFYDVWQLNDHFAIDWVGIYSKDTHYTDWRLGIIQELKSGAQDGKRLMTSMYQVGWYLAQASADDMITFNTDITGEIVDNPAESWDKQLELNERKIGFTTVNGAVALALSRDNVYYLLTDSASTEIFKVYEPLSRVTQGYVGENGEWVAEKDISVSDNGDGTFVIPCESATVIRLEFTNIVPENIAKGKPTTVSGYYDDTSVGTNATDGLASTQWATLGETTWISVDLGGIYDINRYVVIHHGDIQFNTRDFCFQISDDGENWVDVDVITNNENDITESVVEVTGRFVRLYITDPQIYPEWRGARINEFKVYGTKAERENIALGKTATTSSNYSEWYTGEQAIDGNSETWWATLQEPSWLSVDLQETYNITGYVVEHWGEAQFNTRDFQFQISNDGENWEIVDTVIGNTANKTEKNITAKGRYVRLYITNAQEYAEYRGPRIRELQVYGVVE